MNKITKMFMLLIFTEKILKDALKPYRLKGAGGGGKTDG